MRHSNDVFSGFLSARLWYLRIPGWQKHFSVERVSVEPLKHAAFWNFFPNSVFILLSKGNKENTLCRGPFVIKFLLF